MVRLVVPNSRDAAHYLIEGETRLALQRLDTGVLKFKYPAFYDPPHSPDPLPGDCPVVSGNVENYRVLL